MVIKNVGDGNAKVGSIKVRFYLSKDNVLSSDDFGFGNRTIPISPLPKVGESTNNTYGVSLEGSDIGSNRSYGDYYILIVIDEPNELGGTEINTDNNISVIPVKYTGTSPKTINNKLDVNVLDLNGNIITKTTVKDKNEAIILFNNLNIEEGLYFLHTYDNGKLIEKSQLYKTNQSNFKNLEPYPNSINGL